MFFWHPYFLNVLAFSRDFPCSTNARLSFGAAMDVGRGRIYPEDTWAAGLLHHRISKGQNMSGVASIPVESLDHKVRTDTVFVKVVCDMIYSSCVNFDQLACKSACSHDILSPTMPQPPTFPTLAGALGTISWMKHGKAK